MWSGLVSIVKTVVPQVGGFVKNIVIGTSSKDVLNIADKAISKSKSKKDSPQGEPSKKVPNWQRWFPFTLVYGNGRFQPMYLYACLFVVVTIAMFTVKIYAAYVAIINRTYTPELLPTADLALLVGLVPSLILVYNKTKNKEKMEQDTNKDVKI